MVVSIRNVGVENGGTLTANNGASNAQTRIGRRYTGGFNGGNVTLNTGGMVDWTDAFSTIDIFKHARPPQADTEGLARVDVKAVTADFTPGETVAQGSVTGTVVDFFTVKRIHFTSGGGSGIDTPVRGQRIYGQTSNAVGQVYLGIDSSSPTNDQWVLPRQTMKYPSYQVDGGTWTAGDAVGFFDVEELSGTFTTEELHIGSDTNAATVSSIDTVGVLILKDIVNGPFVDNTLVTSAGGSATVDYAHTGGQIGGASGQWVRMGYEMLQTVGGNVDANGYFTAWPQAWTDLGVSKIYYWMDRDDRWQGNPAGDYVFKWEGDPNAVTMTKSDPGGNVTITNTAIPNEIHFTIHENGDNTTCLLAINLSDWGANPYPKNFTCIKTTNQAAYDAGEIWDPDWLNTFKDGNGKPAEYIRHMGWNRGNESWPKNGYLPRDDVFYDGRNDNLDYYTWQWPPHAAIVNLHNKLKCDPYITIPYHNCSLGSTGGQTAYAEALATYYRANLHPDLCLRVEVSNERWNTAFPQWHYDASREWALLGWDKTYSNYTQMKNNIDARTEAVIFKAIKDVYGPAEAPHRVQTVSGWHSAAGASGYNGDIANPTLWAANDGAEHTALGGGLGQVDAVAITNYFGNGYIQHADLQYDLLTFLRTSPTEAAKNARIYSDLTASPYEVDTGLYSYIDQTVGWITNCKTLADTHSKPLILYEGGTHVLHNFAIGEPFHKFTFTSGGTATPVRDDVITGAASGATARVLGFTLTGGSWGNGDAAGELCAEITSGTFAIGGEELEISAVNVATLVGEPQEYFNNGNGATIPFTSGGTTPPAYNDVISGVTSGATATVHGWTLTSGSWAGGDAAGELRVLLTGGSPNFNASEELEISAVNVATTNGAQGTWVRDDPEYNSMVDDLGVFGYSTETGYLYHDLTDGIVDKIDGGIMEFVNINRPSKFGAWAWLRHTDDTSNARYIQQQADSLRAKWWNDPALRDVGTAGTAPAKHYTSNVDGISVLLRDNGDSTTTATIVGPDADYTAFSPVALTTADVTAGKCFILGLPVPTESPANTFVGKTGLVISPYDDVATVTYEWMKNSVGTGDTDLSYTDADNALIELEVRASNVAFPTPVTARAVARAGP